MPPFMREADHYFKSLESRVHSAAAWLDVRYPGWHRKIDLGRLDMHKSKLCIGGQIGVSWMTLRREFEEETGIFNLGIFSSPTARDIWAKEVLQRRQPRRFRIRSPRRVKTYA